jgi:hypothetical protein
MRRSEIFKSLYSTFLKKDDENPEREMPLPQPSSSQDEVII